MLERRKELVGHTSLIRVVTVIYSHARVGNRKNMFPQGTEKTASQLTVRKIFTTFLDNIIYVKKFKFCPQFPA